MGGLNIFDYIFLAVILFLGVRSLLRGFFREAGTIAGIIAGIIAARVYYQDFAPFFTQQVKSAFLADALAFATIFFVVYALGIFSSILVQKLVHKTVGGWLDRTAGFIFGALKGLVLCGIFIYLVSGFAGSLENSFLKNSVISPCILNFMDFLSGLVSR